MQEFILLSDLICGLVIFGAIELLVVESVSIVLIHLTIIFKFLVI